MLQTPSLFVRVAWWSTVCHCPVPLHPHPHSMGGAPTHVPEASHSACSRKEHELLSCQKVSIRTKKPVFSVLWDQQGPRRNRSSFWTLKHCCLCTGYLLLSQLIMECISQYWYCLDWLMVFNTCWRYSDKSFFPRPQSPYELFLQKSVKATGADVPQAVLDYIRNNDVLILEGCDKVCSHYLEACGDDLSILYHTVW